MAQPLVKCKADGTPYVRPRAREKEIDEAIRQDLRRLHSRVGIRDHTSSDYISSECLVHLIRKARRDGNQAVLDILLPPLLLRCERHLVLRYPDDSFAKASELREEILFRLTELFAVDGTERDKNKLDFFEVRFNKAFLALKVTVQRSFGSCEDASFKGTSAQLPADTDEGGEKVPEIFSEQAMQLDDASRAELHEAVDALPPDERAAITLCHLMGYEVESVDPSEQTAATLCGVTGRTIRNRLARAYKKLSRFKEDL